MNKSFHGSVLSGVHQFNLSQERTLNMKNLFVFALIAFILGATTASTAKADRDGRALIGGIIGGLIIGSIIDNDDHHHHSRVSVSHHSNRCSCSGHHDTVSVKTWVNGGWSVHYDNHGRRHRDWHPGHYAYTTRRVWVSHDRGCGLYSNSSHGDYYNDGGYREDYRRHRR